MLRTKLLPTTADGNIFLTVDDTSLSQLENYRVSKAHQTSTPGAHALRLSRREVPLPRDQNFHNHYSQTAEAAPVY